MYKIFVLFLIGVQAVCSSPVVGGRIVPARAVPYQVAVYGLRALCGGSIISSRTVLTAAHCLFDKNKLQPSDNFVILAGTNDMSSLLKLSLGKTPPSRLFHRNIHLPRQIIIHPEYNDTGYDGDIALVILSQPIIFSSVKQPVRIAGGDYHMDDNKMLTATGWGYIDANRNVRNNYLRTVNLNYVNNYECWKTFLNVKLMNFTENRLESKLELIIDSFEDIDSTGVVRMICAFFDLEEEECIRNSTWKPLILNFIKTIINGSQEEKLCSNTNSADSACTESSWGSSIDENPKRVFAVILEHELRDIVGKDKEASNLCTVSNPGSGICSGDSGGPLVDLRTNTQVGISSFLLSSCADGLPNFFTRVSFYADWIKENIVQ